MREIKIILVGRIRRDFRAQAFDYYLKKTRPYTRISVVTVRDAPDKDPALRRSKEGAGIMTRLDPRDYVLALDEKGKEISSTDFAKELLRLEEDPGKIPCFVVGGAFGLSDEVRSAADTVMSLGPMTLPHELAAMVLMEQIYRAQTILRGHPYHH